MQVDACLKMAKRTVKVIIKTFKTTRAVMKLSGRGHRCILPANIMMRIVFFQESQAHSLECRSANIDTYGFIIINNINVLCTHK